MEKNRKTYQKPSLKVFELQQHLPLLADSSKGGFKSGPYWQNMD